MNTSPSPLLKIKHLAAALLCTFFLSVALGSCHNAELWDELSPQITSFINQYYPGSELNSVTHTGGTTYVRIDRGAGLTFDADNQWTAIDGYGLPLPQVLLFDQLPPRMYEYLQETSQTNAVFAITRDADTYTASLIENTLTYNTTTGSLTGK